MCAACRDGATSARITITSMGHPEQQEMVDRPPHPGSVSDFVALVNETVGKHFKCCICLSIFDTPVMLPCNHAMCRTCASQALKQKQRCPECLNAIPNLRILRGRNAWIIDMVNSLRSCLNEAGASLTQHAPVPAMYENAQPLSPKALARERARARAEASGRNAPPSPEPVCCGATAPKENGRKGKGKGPKRSTPPQDGRPARQPARGRGRAGGVAFGGRPQPRPARPQVRRAETHRAPNVPVSRPVTRLQEEQGPHNPAAEDVVSDDVGRTVPPAPPPPLALGDLVFVSPRTWPGMNKYGGVARVQAVLDPPGSRYDVKYIVGQQVDRGVEACYIRPHHFSDTVGARSRRSSSRGNTAAGRGFTSGKRKRSMTTHAGAAVIDLPAPPPPAPRSSVQKQEVLKDDKPQTSRDIVGATIQPIHVMRGVNEGAQQQGVADVTMLERVTPSDSTSARAAAERGETTDKKEIGERREDGVDEIPYREPPAVATRLVEVVEASTAEHTTKHGSPGVQGARGSEGCSPRSERNHLPCVTISTAVQSRRRCGLLSTLNTGAPTKKARADTTELPFHCDEDAAGAGECFSAEQTTGPRSPVNSMALGKMPQNSCKLASSPNERPKQSTDMESGTEKSIPTEEAIQAADISTRSSPVSTNHHDVNSSAVFPVLPPGGEHISSPLRATVPARLTEPPEIRPTGGMFAPPPSVLPSETPPPAKSSRPFRSKPAYNVGDLVTVQYESSPGVNKEGGVARITQCNSTGTYNVKYLMRKGTGRGVDPGLLSRYDVDGNIGERSPSCFGSNDTHGGATGATNVVIDTRLSAARALMSAGVCHERREQRATKEACSPEAALGQANAVCLNMLLGDTQHPELVLDSDLGEFLDPTEGSPIGVRAPDRVIGVGSVSSKGSNTRGASELRDEQNDTPRGTGKQGYDKNAWRIREAGEGSAPARSEHRIESATSSGSSSKHEGNSNRTGGDGRVSGVDFAASNLEGNTEAQCPNDEGRTNRSRDCIEERSPNAVKGRKSRSPGHVVTQPSRRGKRGAVSLGASEASSFVSKRRGRARSLVLTLSGLNPSMTTLAKQLAKSHGWKVESKYTEEVTHVVCRTAAETNKANIRSAKFLRAVAAGKWVVNEAWLEQCKVRGGHAQEEAFEISGDKKSDIPAAPRRSRLAHSESDRPGLFLDTIFHFRGEFGTESPPRSELEPMLKANGGIVAETLRSLFSRRDVLPVGSSGGGGTGVEVDSNGNSERRRRRIVLFQALASSPEHDARALARDLASLSKSSSTTGSTSSGQGRAMGVAGGGEVEVMRALWLVDCIGSFRVLNPTHVHKVALPDLRQV